MRPVVPGVSELPDNVEPVKFTAPKGQEEEVGDIVGVRHKHPETGETVALEFMFEVSEKEIAVLKHEPYVTFTIAADHLHPFAIQTSYPYDEKYESLNEHTHICTSNFTHDENQWWRCDNPRHNPIAHRMRECDECWRKRTILADSED